MQRGNIPVTDSDDEVIEDDYDNEEVLDDEIVDEEIVNEERDEVVDYNDDNDESDSSFSSRTSTSFRYARPSTLIDDDDNDFDELAEEIEDVLPTYHRRAESRVLGQGYLSSYTQDVSQNPQRPLLIDESRFMQDDSSSVTDPYGDYQDEQLQQPQQPSSSSQTPQIMDDIEYQESMDYLKASLVTYIQANCPTEVGYPVAMCIIRNQGTPNGDMPGIDPNCIPVKYSFCITVPKTALVEDANTFGGFDLNTDVGRIAFKELEFFRRAFCDSSLGERSNHVSPYKCPQESELCTHITGAGVAPKIITVVEPIFRNVIYSRYYPENSPIPIERREVSMVDMLVPDNIVGYRVWFFVIDFSIDPIDAITKRIVKNREEMGLAPLTIKVSEKDAFVDAVSTAWLKKDPMKTFSYIRTLNASADKANVGNQKQKLIYAARKANADPRLFAHYEIQNILDIYNVFRVHESRCLQCDVYMCCNNCATLPFAHAILINPDQNELIYARQAKFGPIPRGSVAATVIDGALYTEVPSILRYGKNFIDPVRYLNHTNPTALEMLAHLEACPEQLDPLNYNSLTSPNNERVKFPFPNLVFTFNARDFGSEDFMNTKLPWAYDLFNITMDCIKRVVKIKRKNANCVQDREYFNKLSSFEAREQRANSTAIAQSLKRTIPKPIHPEAQGKEYDEVNQQFVRAEIPMPGDFYNINKHVVKGVNEIRDCALKMSEKIKQLQSVVNYIGKGSLRKLLEIMQKQGMRDLKRLFIPTSKTTENVRTASVVLLKLIRNGETAFFEMNRVAHNLESYSADFLLQLYFYFESVGVLHNHHVLVDIILSAWRASHCPITDALYQHTSLLLNMILQGTAAVGKSFLIDVAAVNLLPGSMPRKSSASRCAIYRIEPEDGRVEIYDEISPGMDPGKPGTPEDKEQISKNKERMTSHFLTHEVTNIGSNGNIEERTTKIIASEIHNVILLIGNDLSVIPGFDDSWISRFLLIIINAAAERKGSVDLISKATPFKDSSIVNLLTSPMMERQENMIRTHALHVAYSKGIATGAFIPPNLNMLSFHFVPVYKHMVKLIPSIGRSSRGAERLTSKALSLAIANGIYLIFNSIYSPLIEFDEANKQIKYAPFSLDQLSFIQPYTFLPEDSAIGLIVEHFHNTFVPALYWKTAVEIATIFANYNEGLQWNFKKIRVGSTNCVDVNYLHCDCKIGVIVAALAKRGINEYSARLIIRFLLVMEINIYSVLPRPEDRLESADPIALRNASRMNGIYNKKVEAANQYSNIMMKCPVFQLETPCGKTYVHPNQMLEDSELYINVHYLKKFSPEQITAEIMKVICYKGIRPRRVLLNIADESLPFVPKTWDLVPQEHSQTANPSETVHKFIKRSLCSKHALSLHSKEMSAQLKRRTSSNVTFHATDAETELCLRWLNDNPVYDPAREMSCFTPKQINEDIACLSRINLPNEKRTNYPDDIYEYYNDVEIESSFTGIEENPNASFHLNQEELQELEALEEEALTGPSQPSSSESYRERLSSMVDKHTEIQRAQANTSSSSTSSSSSSSATTQPVRLPYHRMTNSSEPTAKKQRTNSSYQPSNPALNLYQDDF